MDFESAITFATLLLAGLCVAAFLQSPNWKTGTRALAAVIGAAKAID